MRWQRKVRVVPMEQDLAVDQGKYSGCVRAFDALASAHERIAGEMHRALQAKVGLSLNEFRTMMTIAESGACSLSDLLLRQSVSQSALSRLVARLEQRDLVERLADEADARICRVRLSAKGRRLLELASQVHMQCLQRHLFDLISDSERELLRAILLKIGG